jgi:acyl carrier protein
MVPNLFVGLETLPLTPNGKIDRNALPQPEATRRDLLVSYVAPRTPVEHQIADIWAQVLKLDQVGIHDNFFELGGYSLLAIQIVSRLRPALQVEIPLPILFELPTVAALAERVETLRWVAQGAQAVTASSSDDYEEGDL